MAAAQQAGAGQAQAGAGGGGNKIWRKFTRNPLGLVGLTLVVIFAVVALLAPLLAPMPADQGSVATVLSIPVRMASEGYSSQPTLPSAAHPLGLSENGYDIKFGIVWGTRTAFVISLLIVLLSLVIGLVVGTLAGYYGGWTDTVMMRFTDIIFAFPVILLLIVLAVVLGRSLPVLIVAFALVTWGSYARLIRSEILKVKRLEYVEGARALGGGDLRVVLRHVLPNSLTSLLVVVSSDIGSIVVTFAALSFIGVGAPAGFPDWGQLMLLSKNWINQPEYWFTYIYPGVALILFSLAWNLVGDSLRDAIDPRSR